MHRIPLSEFLQSLSVHRIRRVLYDGENKIRGVYIIVKNLNSIFAIHVYRTAGNTQIPIDIFICFKTQKEIDWTTHSLGLLFGCSGHLYVHARYSKALEGLIRIDKKWDQ